MNKLRRSLFQLFLPTLLLGLCAAPARATTVIMLADRDLILDARVIVTGEVRSVFSAWDDERTRIWTYVEVRTDRAMKGAGVPRRIVLKQPGGMAGFDGMLVFGQPIFASGQQVVLYLNPGLDGTLRVAHAFMGMFEVVQDGASGERLLRRAEPLGDVRILARPEFAPVSEHIGLDEHLRLIETTLASEAGRLAQRGAERDAPAIQFVPPEYERKRLEASDLTPYYAFMSGGVRWMEADSGQPVRFSFNPARAPVSGGGRAETIRAMQAWAAQSGARISLQIGGDTTSCGSESDNANVISFGDCRGELDPPFNCSGVLAQTTIWYNFETRTVGGQSFKRLVEADVVFNDGFGCFLDNSANLAEVACHELGHAIGLAHSSAAGAIMRPSVQGGGRDATLGEDDKAGVRAIYPSSGGGPGGGGGGGTGGGGTGGGNPVSITTGTLPSGTVGRSYRQQLKATGGMAPYRWSVVGSQMPPGLQLNADGWVEGTPTRSGTYSVGVQVTDNQGGLAADRVSIIIAGTGGGEVPVNLPSISRVQRKGTKKLFIFGGNFRADSAVVVNGKLLKTIALINADGQQRLTAKGKLKLGPAGTNSLFVVSGTLRSESFIF